MTVTQLDWDQWRADYDVMSFADHQAFNAECLRLHPDQRSWNASALMQVSRPPARHARSTSRSSLTAA